MVRALWSMLIVNPVGEYEVVTTLSIPAAVVRKELRFSVPNDTLEI